MDEHVKVSVAEVAVRVARMIVGADGCIVVLMAVPPHAAVVAAAAVAA